MAEESGLLGGSMYGIAFFFHEIVIVAKCQNFAD